MSDWKLFCLLGLDGLGSKPQRPRQGQVRRGRSCRRPSSKGGQQQLLRLSQRKLEGGAQATQNAPWPSGLCEARPGYLVVLHRPQSVLCTHCKTEVHPAILCMFFLFFITTTHPLVAPALDLGREVHTSAHLVGLVSFNLHFVVSGGCPGNCHIIHTCNQSIAIFTRLEV